MPKLDETFESAQESASGDFKAMEPGTYMCRIQAVNTEWETRAGIQKAEQRQCVQILVDVDEGEHAGEFSRDFYIDKPYAHSFYMSWTPAAMGILKHTFKALDEANHGFDSRAAFEADRWEHFIGKRLLMSWQGTEYMANNGMVRVRVRPDRALVAGDNPRIQVEMLGGEKTEWSEYRAKPAEEPAAPAADNYGDLPF